MSTLPPALWPDTATIRPAEPASLKGDVSCDVAIVGGGYTGLSAALHLARDHRLRPVVLEARRIGWGASGRNGGFCVPGGAKVELVEIAREHGEAEARRFFDLSLQAVERVACLIESESIEAQPQGGGELVLAHSEKAMAALVREREDLLIIHGHRREIVPPEALAERGLRAAGFHGGVLEPVGFALHPLDYVRGLAAAARRHGALVVEDAEVTAWRRHGAGHELLTAGGRIRADAVILATGAYAPERLDRRIAGRILPVRSNIVATRPLTIEERSAQGWTSTQPACDSRALLHYFRLLPDGRFLFGGRGGVSDHPKVAAAFRQRLETEFRQTFPRWAHVETTHFWHGLVDVAVDRLPHCGAFSDDPTVFIGCAYHGSGVSMATETGAQLARLAARLPTPDLPEFMRAPPGRFPLPWLRPFYLSAALAGQGLRDRLS